MKNIVNFTALIFLIFANNFTCSVISKVNPISSSNKKLISTLLRSSKQSFNFSAQDNFFKNSKQQFNYSNFSKINSKYSNIDSADKHKLLCLGGLISIGFGLYNYIDVRDSEGKTLLIRAVCSGDIEKVKSLLRRYKTNINAKDRENKTALVYAIMKGHTEIAQLLIGQPDIDINSEITYDTYLTYWDGFGEDFDEYDTKGTVLHAAIECVKPAIVKALLKHPNIDVNIKSDYVLPKNDAMIIFTDLRIKNTPLAQAIFNFAQTRSNSNSKKKIIDLLLKHQNIDVNRKSYQTVLHDAVFYNEPDIVESLLKHPNIDVSIKDRFNHTALDNAKKKNRLEIINLFEKYKK